MERTLLTLNEVADELGLHYMTVYRYVRSGQLAASKVRGEWQVDRADLAELTIGSDPATRDGSRRAAAQSFTRRIRAGDEPGAWAIVQRALTSGADPWEIHTRLLAPAVAQVLQSREASGMDGREQSDAVERHRAVVVAERVAARLAPRFRPDASPNGTLLLAAPSEDHATLPLTVLADLCRLRGFRVAELGGHSPIESMLEEARRVRPLLAVCIHCSRNDLLAELDAQFMTLRAELPGTPLVLSTLAGAGAPIDPHAIGADYHFDRPEDVVAQLEAIRASEATDPGTETAKA